MQKEVYSAHSGRKLAKIEFVNGENLLTLGDRLSFRVLNGFGNLWRKSFDEEEVTVRQDDQELLVRIVAFPAEKEGVGLLDIEQPLPPRSAEPKPELEPVKSLSLAKRVRGYFSRPRH